MADNRKDFRPRRLAFGGRCFPRACSLAAALAICVAVAQAHAEDAGLKNGAASLAAGKYDAAVRQLSATINSDNAARGDAAKAFYLRGLAYRKMGESARAIADLGAAIWLGLPESETLKALVNRGLAYKAAGLTREGDAQIAAARKAGGNSTIDAIIAEGGGTNAGRRCHRRLLDRSPPRGSGGSERKRRRPAGCPQRSCRATDPHRQRLADCVEHLRFRRPATQQREQRQPSHALVRLRDRLIIRTGAPSRARAGAAGRSPAAEAGRTAALDRRGELELVHHDRDARSLGQREQRRKRQPLVAPVQPQRRGRASSATGRGAIRRRWRLPAATRHQPLRGRSQGAVEEGLGERRPALNRKSRRSISAISALSGASASDPFRTRRKALKSATP